MAHLRACILYFMDISEQCGSSVSEQLSLFENIRPLFANKPLVVVVNKIDILSIKEAPADVQEALKKLEASGVVVMEMSNVNEVGVIAVRNAACDALLETRVEAKLKSNKANDILNRLHVATPISRDDKKREPFIPPTALARRKVRQPVKLKGRAMITPDQLPDTTPK